MSWIRASQHKAAILLVVLGMCQAVVSQEVSAALLQPARMESGAFVATPVVKSAPVTLPETRIQHRFWDRENSVLFAGSAAFSAADFVVTRNNLRNGGQELNPVTGWFSSSTAGLAVNFAGETVGVVGLSYLFHKTGHHKMERAVSILNIGASAGAVMFDVAHR